MDQAPASDLKVWAPLEHINIVQCSLIGFGLPGVQEPQALSSQTINVSPPSVTLDVGSWREGGGRNLITATSPSEMDNRAPEEGSTGLGTSTPPGEADEPGRNVTADVQREKRDDRERLPPSALPQAKLNGQQPPAGVPTHFDPAFRSMMPPYVSHSLLFWTDHVGTSKATVSSCSVYLFLSLRDNCSLCLF